MHNMIHPEFNFSGVQHVSQAVSPIPPPPLPAGKGGNSENEFCAVLWHRTKLIFGYFPRLISGCVMFLPIRLMFDKILRKYSY